MSNSADSMRKKMELKQAFDAATSADEMLIAFKNLSTCFQEKEISHQSWKLVQQLLAEGCKDPHQKLMQLRFGHIRTKGKAVELKKAFCAAKSADEMLKAFTKMDPHFDEAELGIECVTLAMELHGERYDPETILLYGKRALKFAISRNNDYSCHGFSLMLATVLHLLGSASCALERYNESLSYLKWADRNLGMLELDPSCPAELVHDTLKSTQFELKQVKTALGRGDEAVVHMKRILEILEKTLPDGSIEIGNSSMGVADVYLRFGNFEGALPYALKGLEIYAKHLGDGSLEIAQLRKCLGDIQDARKDCDDKAMEQNILSMNVLKITGRTGSYDLVGGDTGEATMLLGFVECMRAMEAVTLRAKTQQAEDGEAAEFVATARELCDQKRYAAAKKYMISALRILDRKEMKPLVLATGLWDLSKLYEQMNDFGNAMLLLRRVLAIPKLPRNHLLDCTSRLFSLISLTGRHKNEISYLEDVVKRLREEFGPDHCQVGHGYKMLGISYAKLGKFERAAKFMALAKDIMDVTLGPHHLNSLLTSQTLAIAYADMRSYDHAIQIQKMVVEGFKGLGPSEQGKLDEAIGLLKQMKEHLAVKVPEECKI